MSASALVLPPFTPPTYHQIVSPTLRIPVDSSKSIPVGLLACQRDPLLRELVSTVVSCTIAQSQPTPARKSKKDKSQSAQDPLLEGLSIHRPIIYCNTATVLAQKDRETLPTPDHTHRWTVAVRSAASAPDSDIVGGADDLSYFIKRVTFKLHDTYPNSNRNVDRPPFEVSETGWGEFEVQIRVTFVAESGEEAITFYHHLKLHPWTVIGSGEPENPPLEAAAKMGPVHSWQYDDIVFHDPFQSFLNILTTHPPTSLPKAKRRPIPFHTSNPASLEASKGGVPEFTAEMEKEEIERLESARKTVIAEQDKWRAMLIEKEKELERLRKQLAEA